MRKLLYFFILKSHAYESFPVFIKLMEVQGYGGGIDCFQNQKICLVISTERMGQVFYSNAKNII